MVEFVAEWFIEETLGEGAFGDVKLLVNRRTQDAVALKTVNIKDHPEADDIVKKEVLVHKMLNHENIVKFYGNRRDKNIEYIFLEYCSGGELYDRIEPDIGVSGHLAQVYFRQLIGAVEFLHSLGFAHRDIKPENILLDGDGKIKLTDFGFATVFRSRGSERLLDKRCGTPPYVAPEVLLRPYRAAPADVWSCGIVLLALLAGELPWDRPTSDCASYKMWKEGNFCGMPWTKLDINALNFIKRILCPQASKRITIDQIHGHSWMTKRPIGCPKSRKRGLSPLKKKNASGDNLVASVEDSITRLCYSQPEPIYFGVLAAKSDEDVSGGFTPLKSSEVDAKCLFSFSQPVGTSDDFFVGSQLTASPTKNSLPTVQRLVKRMTRFFVQTGTEATLKELTQVLDDLGYMWKIQTQPVLCVTISLTDRRKNKLVFKACVIEMGSDIRLLDFRLSQGDGLEFKRQFLRLKDIMSRSVVSGPLTIWQLAMATNQVPS